MPNLKRLIGRFRDGGLDVLFARIACHRKADLCQRNEHRGTDRLPTLANRNRDLVELETAHQAALRLGIGDEMIHVAPSDIAGGKDAIEFGVIRDHQRLGRTTANFLKPFRQQWKNQSYAIREDVVELNLSALSRQRRVGVGWRGGARHDPLETEGRGSRFLHSCRHARHLLQGEISEAGRPLARNR